MPKYYCDYCDTFLTHDSPSVRKTHCTGRKHKDNVKFYYQKWMEEQAQHLIDATTAAFKAGKIASNPFAQPPPGAGPMGLPPRPGMPGFNPMLPPPMAPPNFAGQPPNFMGFQAMRPPLK
ncbi:CLUMA_CG013375, isoform A [Clunio marinus]|uniref:U1 small nuclear ribonucleoprotein C n=1 Tax=Clunio marinus TaxID=568069 RepID=A0A1J1IIN3_9DIPT|nr:CLUMA_CG013375, isoform A [Clunio marinus]